MEAGIRVKIAFGDSKKTDGMRRFSGSRVYHKELNLIKATQQSQASQYEIKPENLPVPQPTRISGVVHDENGQPLFATVELTDKISLEKLASVNSSSQDGTYDVAVPAGKDYSMAVKSANKMLHTDNVDLSGDKKTKVIAHNIKLQAIAIGASTILKNIEFPFAKTAFSKSSVPELMEVVKWMEQHPTVRIEIGGYTDNVGTQATNMRVSEGRAKAVYDILVRYGVAAERLEYKAYGASNPIASNDTKEGRAKNRRVEMKVIGL